MCNGNDAFALGYGWTNCTDQPGEDYAVTPVAHTSSLRLTCLGSCPMLPPFNNYRGVREIQVWPRP